MVKLRERIVRRSAVVLSVAMMGAGTSVALAPTASAAGSCQTGSIVVNTNGVNFRTGHGTNYSSLGILYKGDCGWQTEGYPGWFKIKLDKTSKTGLKAGTTGWVSIKYAN
ncbi:hypothetical protein [Streptomyces sp. NBC_00859]|uniref:hypothetical protein n=1 Tax=Streptomyces sp. NBC_00859 TaxID=2903682 RepID=UPI003869AF30|nr:hypothetical protein OG584_32415 [Streptomyces sp. NBC_00859]